MPFRFRLSTWLLLLLLNSSNALANTKADKNSLSLDPLFPGEKHVSLKQSDLKDKFFMFFKPACASCRRQVKDLECLSKDKVFFMAMAFSSSEQELKKEARLMGLWKRTYLADEKVKKAFRIKKDYSPQLFVFNREGEVKKWLGETNCQELRLFLEGQ